MKSVGASEVPIVLGLSPFATPLQLYLVKSELVAGPTENAAMQWGHRLEQPIADAFSESSGLRIRNPGDYTIYRRRNGTVCMHATPDRFAGDGVLEIKTVGQHMAHHWKDADGLDYPPAYVLAQLQAVMHCTNREVGHIACLIAGQKFLCFEDISRDRAFCVDMEQRCMEFMCHVQGQVPPAADAVDLEAVAKLYRDAEDESVTALGWQESMLADLYDEADSIIKTYKRQLDEAKANLQLVMGEHERAVLPDGSGFTWKANVNGSRVFRRTKSNGSAHEV